MKKITRILSMLLAVVLLLGLAACGGTATTTDNGSAATTGTPATNNGGNEPAEPAETPDNNILVIGCTGSFEEKWNPFIAESVYDKQILSQIFVPIQELNGNNEMADYGGVVTAEETSDGGVLYTVRLNEGMYFTDGVEVTINDYIWSLYVRADPSYTGLSAMTPVSCYIEGIGEYYYDAADYSVRIAEIQADADANWAEENISFENFLEYAIDTDIDGMWDGTPGEDWNEYIIDEGYEADLNAIDATDADAVRDLLARIEYDNYLQYYDAYSWYLEKAQSEYALGNLAGGANVTEISGIQKIDEYTCTIKYTQVSIVADRDLFGDNGAGTLVPSHYYGDFEKGDVAHIISNMTPLGSGPYIWGGFADNIVTCTANADYWLGVPKTGTVRWQYIPEDDIVTSLVSGLIDMTQPNSTTDNIAALEAAGIRCDLIDNDGYGYVGFNHNNLSLYVRKGLASLMNRAPAVEGYYKGLASVIERPMTTTVSEYPTDATEYYGYNPEKALEYFEMAGYSQVNGKLVDENGKQLVVNAYVGGSGTGAHPSYSMLVQAAEDMAALGGELQVQDVNFNVLQAAMNDGTADMFCLAWSAVTTCDKWSQFHTEGTQNRFNVSDPTMDALLDQINLTVDFEERKALVSEMLDLAMDLVTEFPVYQRYNLIAINPANLNLDSIPESNTFHHYANTTDVLWQIQMAG